MTDLGRLLADVNNELILRRSHHSRDADNRITSEEWHNIITEHLVRATEGAEDTMRYRAELLQVMAKAGAAILASDRKYPRERVAGAMVRMGP